MKYLNLLVLLFLGITSQAQNLNSLIAKEEIDVRSTPFYPKLIEEVNGSKQWKKGFEYIDSIRISAIIYLSDGLKVRGFLVEPKKKGHYPAIIFNRGGNRNSGALKIIQGIVTLGQIAKEGYVVIASQYRGNAGGEGQEEFGGKDVNDVLNLINVLAEVESADTSNIGMYGWSRGGMMTYQALTKTDKIKAAAVGGAVADQFESIKDRPLMETKVLAELIPNYEKNREAELTKRSAIKWADQFSKKVPVLLLHGNADWRVKSTQSLRLAMEFEKYRVPYRLVIFEGGDHGLSEHREEVHEQVIQWFDKYLKNAEPLPDMEYHGK